MATFTPRLGLVVLLAALPAPAQGEAHAGNEPLVSGASLLRRSHGLCADGALLRGGGADYKVACAARGVELTPALGRRADQSYPLRLELAAIRRGTVELVAAEPATPRLEGKTAVYERGGIAERWEVRPEGVALSFVFPRRPDGAGDLAVYLRVDTELAPQPGAAGELRFVAAGLGGVTIGAVTGIDRLGHRAAGTVRLAGDHVELALPAAFVDSAAYPLVLDPLIGPEIAVSGGTFDDSNPDGAYDATNDAYLVVWQREFSATNVDIRAQRVDSAGVLLGAFLAVTSPSTGVAINPTVASVNLTDRFLVCWQEAASVFGPWDIRGACVDASVGSVSTAVDITSTSANEIEPDAGGESTLLDDEAIVVWIDSSLGLRGAQVTCPAGGGAPIPFAPVTIEGSTQYRKPAISKSGGASGTYVVVSEHVGNNLHAAAFTRNLTILDPLFHVTTSLGLEPDGDGDGSSFLVAFEQPETLDPTRSDILCQRLRYDAVAGGLALVGPVTTIEADAGDDEATPAVGYLGPKYVVAWADEAGTLSYDIGVRELDPSICAPCGPRYSIGTTGRAFDSDPQIATRLAGGDASDEGLLVFGSADNLPPFASEILAQRVEAIGSGGALVSLGGGCGAGGVAAGSGALAIGNPTFAFTLAGADLAAVSAVLNLNGAVAPIPCGACLVTPPLVTIGRPIAGGAATLPIAVPCDPMLIGGTVEVQWYVVTAGSPCFLAPGVSFSSRLQATVGQ